jgi:hypothetical protein
VLHLPFLSNNQKNMQRTIPTAQQIAEIRELVDRGTLFTHLCHRLGISATVGRRWLLELDLVCYRSSPHEKDHLNARQAVEFRTYLESKPTREEIQRKYKIRPEQMCNWFQQLRMELPPIAKNRPTAGANHIYYSSAINTAEMRKEKEEGGARVSIAARFRAQGLAEANPYRY